MFQFVRLLAGGLLRAGLPPSVKGLKIFQTAVLPSFGLVGNDERWSVRLWVSCRSRKNLYIDRFGLFELPNKVDDALRTEHVLAKRRRHVSSGCRRSGTFRNNGSTVVLFVIL